MNQTSNCLSHKSPASACPKSFFQEEQQDLFYPMISVTFVLEDVSIHQFLRWQRSINFVATFAECTESESSEICAGASTSSGAKHFCVHQIVCEVLQPEGHICWWSEFSCWFSVFFFLKNKLLLAFDFPYIPCWNCLKLVLFLVHCCLCIWNLHRLRRRNKFMQKIVMQYNILSFSCDVFFTNPFRHWLHSLSCGCASVKKLNLVFASDALAFSVFETTVSRMHAWENALLDGIELPLMYPTFALYFFMKSLYQSSLCSTE